MTEPDTAAPLLGNGALKPPTRPIRRRWPGRIVKFAVFAAVAGLAVWGAMTWWLPARQIADLITAVATRGDLVINVTERGELDSAKSIQVVCEIEGGGKVASIVPEGTRVKKDEEVVRFDADLLLKGINEQEVKWEQAEGKVKAATSELEVQKNKPRARSPRHSSP